MLRTLSTLAPSLIIAALLLGSSSQARADVMPPEPKEVETPAPEPKVETPPPAEAKTETKTETKSDAKADAKTETKTSSCSIDPDGNRSLLGLAALVLLISGASLRRRDG